MTTNNHFLYTIFSIEKQSELECDIYKEAGGSILNSSNRPVYE